MHLRRRHNHSSGEIWYHIQSWFSCEVFWCCSMAVWTSHEASRLPASLHGCWCASREQERGGDYTGLPRGAWGIPPCAPYTNLRHWWEHAGTTAGCFIPGAPLAHVSLRKQQQAPMEHTSGDMLAHMCWPQGDGHVCTHTAASKRILARATSPAAIAAWGQVTRAHGRAARGRAGACLIYRCLKQEPGTPMVLLG